MSAASWRFLALLVLLLLGAPRGASAADKPILPEAKARYDEAMSLYAARDYRAAIRALDAAYALDPRPEILFAEAQATRLAGDCAAALPLYQRFLATSPPPQQVEATRIAVARCEVPGTSAPPPLPVVVAPVLPPPPPPPAPRWYGDRAGGVLVGVGVVGLGVGAALLASAHAAADDAGVVTDRYDRFASQQGKAESRWGWGLASIIAGSTLVAAGASRYVWVVVHPRGGGLGAGARF